MIKNILGKIAIMMLALILITICNSNSVLAMDETITQADGFLGAANESPIDQEALKSTSDYVYNVLFTIAVVLAFAVGMIIGIKFMFGSVEEQAKVKETLVPYVIGVFVVFASFTIWKIVVSIGEEVSPTTYISANNSQESSSQTLQGIVDNKINVSSLSNSDLMTQYIYNSIDTKLNTSVNDLRNPYRVSSLDEAIEKLEPYQKEIYNECKRRGLLAEDGIWLKK